MKNKFAYALHSGVTMDVTESVYFDLTYSFGHFGKFGLLRSDLDFNSKEFTAHSLKAGIRYQL